MVFEIIKAMRSFLVILLLVILGFSLIFKEFDREIEYGDSLFNVYLLLYGQVEADDLSVSEKLFLALITFALSVLLLNLLIAIMTSAYDKIEKKTILTDSKQKIVLIMEALTMKKALFGKRRGKILDKDPNRKGYLFYVVSELLQKEDFDSNKLEKRVDLVKKVVKEELNVSTTVIKEELSHLNDKQNKKLISLIEHQLKEQLNSKLEDRIEKEITKQTED